MGTQQLTDFRDELVDYLDERDDVPEAFLNLHINKAYLYLSRPAVYEHPALQTSTDIALVAATADYALPTNLVSIMRDDGVFLVFSDGHTQRVVRRPFDRLEEDRFLSTGSTGQPSLYARRAQRIYVNVYPSSDLVGQPLRVYYRARPTRLAADADVTVLPDEWDSPIATLSAGYAWAKLGQPQRADYYISMAREEVNSLGGVLDSDAEDPTDGIELGDSGPDYIEVTTW